MFLLQINWRKIQQKSAAPLISAAGLARSETNTQKQARALALNKTNNNSPPKRPGVHYVALAGLKLTRDPPVSASKVLGLKVYAITPS